jgi:hypothetical protein
MKAKYKKLIGAEICIAWGILCALCFLFEPFELITDDGPYTLIGVPVIASSIIALGLTSSVEGFLVSKEIFAYNHIPESFTIITFLTIQFVIYASIGSLIPWDKFRLKSNYSPVPSEPHQGEQF